MLFRAFAAQREGRTDEARRLLAQTATGGDVRGAYHLGRSLTDERLGPPDHESAARWYRWGAQQGYGACARELGLACDRGLGVPRDPAEAVRWYGVAAEKGDAAAMRLLGILALSGEGVQHDPETGHRWLEAAAERDDAEAAMVLAGLHERGEGVPRDPTGAAHWYWVAAGDVDAEDRLPDAVIAGLRRLVPALRELAERGDPGAQFQLARVKTEDIDDRRSLQLLQAAAQQGHPEACYGMAILYRGGLRGLPHDPETSFRWCHASATAGWWPAQHDLAYLYADGYGVATDRDQAWHWLLRAADQGDAESMSQLWMMAEGRSPADRQEAMAWLRLAAERGEKDAMWYLAHAILDGDCVQEDPLQAARWFMASTRAGGAGERELAYLARELTADQLREAERLSDGDGSQAEALLGSVAQLPDELGALAARSRTGFGPF